MGEDGWRENMEYEYKEFEEITDKHYLKIIKIIVSFANTHGGLLEIVTKNGVVEETIEKSFDNKLDVSVLIKKVGKYTLISNIELTVDKEILENSIHYKIHVEEYRKKPIIFEKPGEYDTSEGKKFLFRKGQIVARYSGSTDFCDNTSLHQLIDELLKRDRDRLFQNVTLSFNVSEDTELLPVNDLGDSIPVKIDPKNPKAISIKSISTVESYLDIPSLLEESFLANQAHSDKILSESEVLQIYLERESNEIDEKYLPLLIESSCKYKLPVFYWLSKLSTNGKRWAILKDIIKKSKFPESEEATKAAILLNNSIWKELLETAKNCRLKSPSLFLKRISNIEHSFGIRRVELLISTYYGSLTKIQIDYRTFHINDYSKIDGKLCTYFGERYREEANHTEKGKIRAFLYKIDAITYGINFSL